MKPNDVNKGVEKYLLNTVYRPKLFRKLKSKFNVGDFVRLSKYKHVFEKGYTPNWTTEIFKIRRVQQTNPITYLLIDLEGRNINGTVYAEELQIVANPKFYLIEKIMRTKGNKAYVKWLGLDSNHNEWIHKSQILH